MGFFKKQKEKAEAKLKSFKEKAKDTGGSILSGDLKGAGEGLLDLNTQLAKELARSAAAGLTGGTSELAKNQFDKFKKGNKDAEDAVNRGADEIRKQTDLIRKNAADSRAEIRGQIKDATDAREQGEANKLAKGGRDTARRRQKAKALGAKGRRSTILTTGDEEEGQTVRRTLLGQ